MKKKYLSMEVVFIPINNNLEASGEENCVIITQLEDSDGQTTSRCDMTPDEYIMREWFNNMAGFPVSLATTETCWPST